MESYVLKRNEDLCYRLGMDFDEANELFGSETLSSMQMVQVNGAFDWGTAVKYAVKAILAIGTVYKLVKEFFGSEAPSQGSEVLVDQSGKGFKTGTTVRTCDSIIIYRPDGTIEKQYGSTTTTYGGGGNTP